MSKFQENMDRLNKDKNYHFKEYSGNFEVCSPLPETSRKHYKCVISDLTYMLVKMSDHVLFEKFSKSLMD